MKKSNEKSIQNVPSDCKICMFQLFWIFPVILTSLIYAFLNFIFLWSFSQIMSTTHLEMVWKHCLYICRFLHVWVIFQYFHISDNLRWPCETGPEQIDAIDDSDWGKNGRNCILIPPSNLYFFYKCDRVRLLRHIFLKICQSDDVTMKI